MGLPEQHVKWLALASASPTEAIAQLDIALAKAQSNGDVHDEIALHRALGLAERSRMRLTESIEHLERAIDLADGLGDTVTAAHCRNTLAGSFTYAGRSSEALELMARVIAELPEPDRSQAEAQLVSILSLTGSHREALEKSTTLLTRFTEQGDVVWGARIRQSRSMIHLYLGDPASGIADAEAAIAIYETLGNAAGIARTQHNIASLRGLSGDIIGALAMFDEVEQAFRRLDIPLSIGADGRVATLFAAGLIEDAVSESLAAMKESERLGADGLLVEAAVWHALGLAQLGRWTEVAKSAAIARRVFAKQSRSAWESFAFALEVEAEVEGLLGATLLCIASNDTPVSKHAYDLTKATSEAAEGMRSNGWVQATRAEVIAALVGGAADPADGVAHLNTLSNTLRSAEIAEQQLLGWLCAGAVEFLYQPSQQGLVNAAVIWREGILTTGGSSGRLATLEGNFVANSVRHTLASAGIAALIKAEDFFGAWNWIEDERNTPTTIRLLPGADEDEAKLLSELRALQMQTASPGSAKSLTGLISRQSELERALRARSLSTTPSIQQTIVRPLRDPQLEPTPSASFFLDSGDICVLALPESKSSLDPPVTFHRLGPLKKFERTMRSIRSGAERLSIGSDQWTSIEATLAHDLAVLDQQLIAPWFESREGTALVVDTATPERPLRISAPPELDVAWCALPSLRNRHVILVSSLKEGYDRDSLRNTNLVVSIAGPNLAFAHSEVEAIGRARNARVVMSGAATRDAVRSALSSAHTVHLACHASLRHDQPLFSSLELADGPLFLHELARSGEVAPIIILSACNAGRISRRAGGGAAGFARTLRSLGAEAVVAPLVPVNDELMVAPMVEFHQLLSRSTSTGEALRQVRCSTTLSPQESFTAALCVTFASGAT